MLYIIFIIYWHLKKPLAFIYSLVSHDIYFSGVNLNQTQSPETKYSLALHISFAHSLTAVRHEHHNTVEVCSHSLHKDIV